MAEARATEEGTGMKRKALFLNLNLGILGFLLEQFVWALIYSGPYGLHSSGRKAWMLNFEITI